MGMYDSIYCRVPLPEVGVRTEEFQTRDTPGQFLESYEIRLDGTLWREAYDTVDHSDPDAQGLGRLAGSLARENRRWEREYLTGALRFYSDSELGWLEFEARFQDGTAVEIKKVLEDSESTGTGLRFDPRTAERLIGAARAEEREACAQIVIDRAKEAEDAGDQTLGLLLRTLSLRLRRGK